MWEPQGLYSKFVLKQPTILQGENSIRGLRNYPCSRIAVVYGSGLSSESIDSIKKSVKAYEINFLKKSWEGEPDIDSIQETVAKLEQLKPDVIIAVGGGSVIDGTKMARLFYEFPFFDLKSTRFNFLEWKTKFVAVPTTVGSGSEVSSAAVLINKLYGNKEMIVSHAFIPEVVVFDPDFIQNSPKRVIVSSAIDAMGHILEGYVSNIDNPLTDIYAEKAFEELISIFQIEKESFSSDEILRLQFAGYMGGVVQNHCIVGAAHAIAHQLSTYGYGHAEAVARVLPAVIELNATACNNTREKYNKIAIKAGLEKYSDIISLIIELNDRLNFNDNDEFKDLIKAKLKDEEFVANVIADKGGVGNPIPLTGDYIRVILNKLVS